MGHRLQALASLPWKRLGCFRILAIAATSVVALAAGPSLISGADGKPPLLQPRASISGRILGVDGQPLPGVKVVLYAPRYGGNEEVLATAATDALGRFSFKGLRAWGYNILVFPKDRAIIGRGVNIDAGEQLTLSDMRLEPAFPAAIVVRDPDGKPLAGAHARSLKWSGPAGAAYRVTAFDLSQRLGIPTFVSGTDGRLVLLPLPAGTRLTGIVAHPNFAPAAFDIEVRERSAPPSVKLTKGGFIRIHLSPPERVARLERVQVLSSLRSSVLGTPSPTHYTFENLPIEGDQLVLPVEPGLLTYLYLDHPKFTIVPQMSDGDPSESYLIPAGATQEFRMTVYPKVVFSARLLDRETRKPFGSNDVVIWGYVADPGRAAIDERVGPGWAFAGSTRAAENGDFSLPLTAGRARLRLQPRNSIVEPEFVDLDVRPDDQRRVISVGSRPIPAITGTVVDSKGGPVRSAIVRLHKQFRGLPAVVTD
ncbi:MAG TPA: carboxypeptidase-like regulatory domain-containing protein, partial [Planctomycetaceae bacterium]|nr:carboxypeptidase-like regulatory domain-containing protein [Planctomycetaceae bacterium]